MIRSFKNKETAAIARREYVKKFDHIAAPALRKLAMLEAAEKLSDLAAYRGNGLEALTRDRVGQHSIRINDKYRVCFTWTANGPEDVEIVDYH